MQDKNTECPHRRELSEFFAREYISDFLPQHYSHRENFMKKAIKYIYAANPFYVHWKKHVCPKCGSKAELRYVSKIVNSKSPEAKDYDFSAGDTYFVGDVEYRTRYFYCPKCQIDISFQEMKKFEKDNRKKQLR